MVLSGSASLKDAGAASARRLWTHSLDYDIYLANGHESLNWAERYAVFLDEDMAFHPDYDHPDRTTDDARQVYPVMIRFFEQFDAQMGCESSSQSSTLPHQIAFGVWADGQ